jgi:hypothetical protein
MAPKATASACKSLKRNTASSGTERAAEKHVILLVTSCSRSSECAAALQRELGQPTEIAGSLRQALQQSRRRAFAALVVDEILADADRKSAELLYGEAGQAVPVTLNLAISGSERVVREVRSALRRRQSEWRLAQQAAAQQLRSEFTDAVTGILLSSQMALENPELPPAAARQVRAVYELAASLRDRLGPLNGQPVHG